MVMNEARTNIRLPDELYERIRKLAEQELRSINSQMVTLLKEALEAREKREQK